MKKLACIIVDDESLARDLLASYASRIQQVEVIAKCRNVAEAAEVLFSVQVDLMFLDINMPQTTGIEFLKHLKNPPAVILTTAYHEYAVEGFSLAVTDYLLKPIGFERFEQAMNLVLQRHETAYKATRYEESQKFEDQSIIVRDRGQLHVVRLADIRYIQSMREYVGYITHGAKVLELGALVNLEKSLPPPHFVRAHRSYIVAVAKISAFKGSELTLLDGEIIPVGKTYRKKVREALSSRHFKFE